MNITLLEEGRTVADNELRDVNDQVVDSVTATNFKNLGEMPTLLSNQMVQNALSHANRINVQAENSITLAQTALASAVKNLLEVDAKEAKAIAQMNTGNAMAEQLAALNATVAAMQQAMKGAQTTPPETAS